MRDLYERSEDYLGRSWPVWVLGVLIYAAAGFILLTRVRLPSPLHLIVYSMAAGVLIVTLLDVELAVAGLAMMIPFARPGFTVPVFGGYPLHFSGINVAIVGVWLGFLFRHITDREVASRGPLVRRTPVDGFFMAFIVLASIATLHGFNVNSNSPEFQSRNLLYMKELLMYMAWFYLVVTILRKPEDVRRFVVLFAISGIFVAMLGLQARISGAIEAAGPSITEEQMEAGVAGGRTRGVGAGGWFGLGHPNLYAAFLIMTLPYWFFAIEHLRRGFVRLCTNVAVLFGFVALLYTYSRSGWGGLMIGMGILGLRQPRLLVKLVMFVVLFALTAQLMTLALVGVGVLRVIEMRFEALEQTGLSGRPVIFAGALALVREYPLLGVGLGAFRNHAATTKMTGRVEHAHNCILNYAAELGLPAAIAFSLLLAAIIRMAWQNLRARSVPGLAFVAQGSFAGLIGVLFLMQFAYIFFDRVVGFALYGLFGIIVAFNRMLRDGMIPGLVEGAEAAAEPVGPTGPSRLWIGS
jgi:O-antigen ligase